MKWPEDIKTAKQVQRVLRKRVSIIPFKGKLRYIAGADAAFIGDRAVGTVCIFSYPDLTIVEEKYAVAKSPFPYIPGFLSFREGPAIISAIRKLTIEPDVIIFDGQGIAHPQGLGIASHIGVLIDRPAIGCAKSRLVGEFSEPGKRKGSRSPLKYRGKTVGAVLRTRSNVNPVFVSPGHKTDLRSSLNIILECTEKFRLPEPVRCADRLSKELKNRLRERTG
jgi:deoxyribonuclease V